MKIANPFNQAHRTVGICIHGVGLRLCSFRYSDDLTPSQMFWISGGCDSFVSLPFSRAEQVDVHFHFRNSVITLHEPVILMITVHNGAAQEAAFDLGIDKRSNRGGQVPRSDLHSKLDQTKLLRVSASGGVVLQ